MRISGRLGDSTPSRCFKPLAGLIYLYWKSNNNPTDRHSVLSIVFFHSQHH